MDTVVRRNVNSKPLASNDTTRGLKPGQEGHYCKSKPKMRKSTSKIGAALNFILTATFGFAVVVAASKLFGIKPLKLGCGCNDVKKSTKIWEEKAETAANLAGMISNLPHLSEPDIRHSKTFLLKIMQQRNVQNGRVLDCGAGVGRVSKGLLLPIFDKVDAVDATKKFTEAFPSFVGSEFRNKLGDVFWSPLEEFYPEENAYDVIWIQWVLLYLTDVEMEDFLVRSRQALKRNGLIFVKENSTNGNEDEISAEDGSVTRTIQKFEMLFEKAGLKLVDKSKQPNFPDNLYDVTLFALEEK